jgi:hypothetical protein
MGKVTKTMVTAVRVTDFISAVENETRREDALRIKYQGKMPALLTQRTDLTPAVLKTFVRNGTFSIPPFRKTEISDVQIGEINAYLAERPRSMQAAR